MSVLLLLRYRSRRPPGLLRRAPDYLLPAQRRERAERIALEQPQRIVQHDVEELIYLVIFPDFSHINKGDVIGLLSGIFGAFSIITLSIARENDSTVLIVFYLMAIGTVCNTFMMVPVFVMPHVSDLPCLVGSGLTGVLGQVLLTMGYKHVNARAGSMVSSSRIIFAATMGFFFFSEALSIRLLAGGFMIIASIIGISALRNKTLEIVTSDE